MELLMVDWEGHPEGATWIHDVENLLELAQVLVELLDYRLPWL